MTAEAVTTYEAALEVAMRVGLPIKLIPAFAFAGTRCVWRAAYLREAVVAALDASPTAEVLVLPVGPR